MTIKIFVNKLKQFVKNAVAKEEPTFIEQPAKKLLVWHKELEVILANKAQQRNKDSYKLNIESTIRDVEENIQKYRAIPRTFSKLWSA